MATFHPVHVALQALELSVCVKTVQIAGTARPSLRDVEREQCPPAAPG